MVLVADTDGCTTPPVGGMIAAAGRRLWLPSAATGDGGWPVGDGDSSLATSVCDCEVFRGRPRRKELRIVERNGGDSLPAAALGSI